MRRSFVVLVTLLVSWSAFGAANRWSVSGPEGGLTTGIAVDADDVLYVGTRWGAVLKSVDGADNWYRTGPGLPQNGAASPFIDDQGALLVCTNNEIWASTNGGQSWEKRGNQHLEDWAAGPGGTVYGSSWSSGVVKTADGGRTWTRFSEGLPASGFVGIAVNRSSGAIFVASVLNQGVFRSIDGGAHWTHLSGGLPANFSAYAIGVDPRNGDVWAGDFGHVYRSTDNGQSFSEVPGTAVDDPISVFAFDARVNRTYVCSLRHCFSATSPSGPWTHVETGGLVRQLVLSRQTGGVVYASTDYAGVLATRDAGVKWTPVNRGIVAAEALDIAIDPTDPARAWIATLGGLYRTSDRGASWQLVRAGEIRGVAVHPLQPQVLTISEGGTLRRSTDGGATWTALPGSAGNHILKFELDPSSPEKVYALLSTNTMYRHDGTKWTAGGAIGNTVYEIVADRTAGTVYVAAYNGMHRSTDYGATFTSISNGLPTTALRGLAIDPTDPALLYAATVAGLYRSTNGGGSWAKMEPQGTLHSVLSDVEVDPNDRNLVYAFGYGTYRSTDRGASFRAFGTMTPSPNITRGAVARAGKQLYAATAYSGVAALRFSPVVLPAAASLHGMNAFFHSDVSIVNASDHPVSVTATYRCFGGNCGAGTTTFTMQPRAMHFYEDAVTSLFAAPESGGAIEFDATDHILVASRLYTPSRPAPTYGQFIPGLTLDDAFPSAATASVSFSADNARGFRANSGVFNPLAEQRQLTVKIFDRNGSERGQRVVPLAPHQAMQLNGVFPWTGITGDVGDAYCTFTAADDGPLFAYTSVLDNRSNDPIFVRGCEMHASPTGTTTLPAVASLHGQGGAFFHSDVAVLNTGNAEAKVQATYRCWSDVCGSAVQNFTLAAGEEAVFDDIVVSLFGAAETGGAVEFETDGSIAVTSRLYTPSKPEPTVGQFIHGMTAMNAHPRSVLAPLSYSLDGTHGFRANVGVYNPTGVTQPVVFELYLPNGTKLAEARAVAGARKSVQINNIFAAAGVTVDVPFAYCVVHGEANTPLFAFASVLDNQSQDPVFIYGEAWTK